MFLHAGIVLIIIAVTFAIGTYFKLGTELAMLLSAFAAAIYHTGGIPVRHLVEGAFTYYDVSLIFITATLFINLVKESGGIVFMVRKIIIRFHEHRYLTLLFLTFILMIPGALTGAGAATVLTVGTLVGTVLMYMGISETKTAAIIFLCASMSAAAPPINLWAMMAAAGANMPYVGFMQPLFVITITGAIFTMFFLGAKGENPELEKILKELPEPPAEMNWIRVGTPFFILILLIIAGRLFPFKMPILGLPLMFLIAALAMFLLSPKKLNILNIAGKTIRSLIPLVGIMIVVGILIQIMALSGARGLISLAVVTLPVWFLFASLFIILPVSEGLLQYAVAPLLGVPLIFLFNMKGFNPVIILSAMAVMWPLGDILPPTAVVGRATVIELNYQGRYYKDFLKTCLIPMAFILALCTIFLVFSNQLSFLVGG